MEEWQAKAVADYPDLGVKGSELNRKYVQKVSTLRETDAAFFQNPRWPYTLAEQLSKKPVIPGLEQLPTPRPTPTPVVKLAYFGINNGGSKRVEVIDASDLLAKGIKGQMICMKGVVVKTNHPIGSVDSFFVKLAPDILCEFLVEPFLDKNPECVGHYTDAKLVFENNSISVYWADKNRFKQKGKIGELFKPGEKVIVYGQFTGMGTAGLDKGPLIKDCVLAHPSNFTL